MLLDQKTQESLLARLTNGDGGDQRDQQKSSLETAAPTPNQVQTKVETNSQSESRPAEQPQMIPYDRFQKVNNTKKEYQKRYEEQQIELERLRKELDSSRSTKEDAWLEELLAEPEDPRETKLKDLENRIQTWELKEAEKELSSIVRNQITKNNDLDKELVESVVYQTIAENPNADLDEAVDRLRQFVGYIENRSRNKQVPNQTAPSAPPRPSATGAKNYVPPTDNKPKTLADARAALYNYLKR